MINHKTGFAIRPELQHWLKALYYSISDMGHHHTNPIQLMLGDVKTIKPFAHYPQTAYHFGNNFWRAYYHCHQSPPGPAHEQVKEHGHLHFFTRNTEHGGWAHCFALSINHLGQPIAMFTTNLWVTQGEWFDASRLMQALHNLELDTPDSMVMAWFRAFILAFQDDIDTLLSRRDETMSTFCQGDVDRCREDRDLYQLSILPIQLQQKLSSLLNPVQAVTTSQSH